MRHEVGAWQDSGGSVHDRERHRPASAGSAHVFRHAGVLDSVQGARRLATQAASSLWSQRRCSTTPRRVAETRYTGRVPTDTWPVHFRYISRRLVKEIVQQHEATRPRVKASFSFPLRAIGLTLIRRDPDYLNLYDLTRRATEAIDNLTGSVEFPGTYVRAELDITPGYFTVLMGWQDRSHVDIAAMMTRTHVEDVGSVLVGLFGSISNYTWRVPKSEGLGEIPSDVAGLYEILDRTAEDGDPTLDPERVEDEADVIPESRAGHRLPASG